MSSQLTAFVLELLFPIGIGHLYADRMLYGCIKFGLFIMLMFLNFCVLGKEKDKNVSNREGNIIN